MDMECVEYVDDDDMTRDVNLDFGDTLVNAGVQCYDDVTNIYIFKGNL